MMYILVKKEQVKDKAFHETMPDGRVILPATALKMSGTMEGVTLVSSGAELKALIKAQKKAGTVPATPVEEPEMPEAPTEEPEVPMETVVPAGGGESGEESDGPAGEGATGEEEGV